MRKITTILICAFIVLSFKAAHADDSALSGIAGGAVAPMQQHPTVRMVDEKIDIRLGKNGAVVHCLFTFKNEGPACTVLMGFPERVWRSGGGSGFGKLQHFVSYVDGVKSKIEYRPAERNKEEEWRYSEDYTSWYVKTVKFADNQTRKVTDEYFCRYGMAASTGDPKTPMQFATYVLKTGANWKGPIGKAVITVDATHVPTLIDVAQPKGSVKVDAKHWIWTARNLEPNEDFDVSLYPRYPLINGHLIGGGSWWPMTETNGILMTQSGFLRYVGANVTANSKINTCTIQYGKHTLVMNPGSRKVRLDGKLVTLPVAIGANYSNDGCIIPLSSVVKLLGGTVSKDAKTGRLNVQLTDHRPVGERNYYP